MDYDLFAESYRGKPRAFDLGITRQPLFDDFLLDIRPGLQPCIPSTRG